MISGLARFRPRTGLLIHASFILLRGTYPSQIAADRGETWRVENLEGTPEQVKIWSTDETFTQATGYIPQVWFYHLVGLDSLIYCFGRYLIHSLCLKVNMVLSMSIKLLLVKVRVLLNCGRHRRLQVVKPVLKPDKCHKLLWKEQQPPVKPFK